MFQKDQIVHIREGVKDPVQQQVIGGAEYRVKGLWHEITGKSWMNSDGNPAALHYAIRSSYNHLPIDNNVYYGKIGSFGHLVHESELEA